MHTNNGGNLNLGISYDMTWYGWRWYRGEGGGCSPPGTHEGPAGEGNIAGILPLDNQDHIYCLAKELPQGGFILPGGGIACGQRKLLLGGFISDLAGRGLGLCRKSRSGWTLWR